MKKGLREMNGMDQKSRRERFCDKEVKICKQAVYKETEIAQILISVREN